MPRGRCKRFDFSATPEDTTAMRFLSGKLNWTCRGGVPNGFGDARCVSPEQQSAMLQRGRSHRVERRSEAPQGRQRNDHHRADIRILTWHSYKTERVGGPTLAVDAKAMSEALFEAEW
eukprot:2328448-Pyramimonas_sp.AAC.1